VFQVRSGHSADVPRTYTLEPRKRLTDSWGVAAIGETAYDLSVYGPNGFYRTFKGAISGRHRANLDVHVLYNEESCGITLKLSNRASQSARVSLLNRYTFRAVGMVLRPGESDAKSWSLAHTRGWYDLVITVDGDPAFEHCIAGHVENGEDSISDPAMGGLV
jgi:phospholipase C